ncbi:aldo/keto reductase [Lacticaseibacillus mingshuiensis]|uniref:Aldo/keto reductase n=1 Tax=Lacticaseibacillus mingshuiensis TaxID=2799574 RepID=A0ABW4CID2_9LACO|nr:aldo/keto reductase [Lacticaseibacillus mingshuiensis]
MTKLTDTYTLSNGVKIPQVGFGTWQIPDGPIAYKAVADALAAGYRHIDTAWQYKNEASVGKAVRDSGIARDELFITSKLPAHAKSYEAAKTAIEESMANLGLDQLDLYLIHAPWPWSDLGGDYREANREVWRAMEEFYQSGRVKAIGISNFNARDQKDLYAHATIQPMVLQLQYYIGFTEAENVQAAQDNGMLVEAFSPLATGFLLNNPDVQKVAAAHGVSVAQVAIKYVLQHGLLPLPKATAPQHISQNAQLEFELTPAEMAFLDTLKDTAPGEDDNLY